MARGTLFGDVRLLDDHQARRAPPFRGIGRVIDSGVPENVRSRPPFGTESPVRTGRFWRGAVRAWPPFYGGNPGQSRTLRTLNRPIVAAPFLGSRCSIDSRCVSTQRPSSAKEGTRTGWRHDPPRRPTRVRAETRLAPGATAARGLSTSACASSRRRGAKAGDGSPSVVLNVSRCGGPRSGVQRV
jgi:hypothetical protein